LGAAAAAAGVAGAGDFAVLFTPVAGAVGVAWRCVTLLDC